MEVLKSGDALEKQVLDDARAKASRILAEADRESAAQRREWERRTEDDVRKIEAEKDSRIQAMRQELAASLPLDFMRARLSYIQDSVDRALKDYFAKLAPEGLIRIVSGMLHRIPPVFRGAVVVAYASGIRSQDVKRVVEENVPGVSVEDVKDLTQDAITDGADTGLVLEAKAAGYVFGGP